jgi:hypothetical protein
MKVRALFIAAGSTARAKRDYGWCSVRFGTLTTNAPARSVTVGVLEGAGRRQIGRRPSDPTASRQLGDRFAGPADA